jgi:hypothetical protein
MYRVYLVNLRIAEQIIIAVLCTYIPEAFGSILICATDM